MKNTNKYAEDFIEEDLDQEDMDMHIDLEEGDLEEDLDFEDLEGLEGLEEFKELDDDLDDDLEEVVSKKNKKKEKKSINIKHNVKENDILEDREFNFEDFADQYSEDEKIDINQLLDDLDESKPSRLTREERDLYARENIKLVYTVAQRFTGPNYPKDELISAGYKGFAKALTTFDKNYSIKFSTYAWKCISYDMMHYMKKEGQYKGNSISMNKVLSVDESGNEMEIADLLRDIDYGAETHDETVIVSEGVQFLNEVIESLSPEERYIITHIHGLNGKRTKTQDEIAEVVGMSQANVSKLGQTILVKIKKILVNKYKFKDLNDL